MKKHSPGRRLKPSETIKFFFLFLRKRIGERLVYRQNVTRKNSFRQWLAHCFQGFWDFWKRYFLFWNMGENIQHILFLGHNTYNFGCGWLWPTTKISNKKICFIAIPTSRNNRSRINSPDNNWKNRKNLYPLKTIIFQGKIFIRLNKAIVAA